MRHIHIPALAVAAFFAVPVAASAHVTVKPAEAPADSFTTFVINVPNERDDASTVKVTVKFPEQITAASFQPKPGWKRTVTMVKLDQPIADDEGGQMTERIDTVTWTSTGAKIGPGEFDQFGVSVHVPADEGASLEFPAVQTYSNGEVVRWIGGDEPAPSLAVIAAEGDGHGGGAAAPADEPAASPADTSSADEDGNRATMALGVGAAGLVAGVASLAAALRRRS
jgi:uncharacterized protein YcnI